MYIFISVPTSKGVCYILQASAAENLLLFFYSFAKRVEMHVTRNRRELVLVLVLVACFGAYNIYLALVSPATKSPSRFFHSSVPLSSGSFPLLISAACSPPASSSHPLGANNVYAGINHPPMLFYLWEAAILLPKWQHAPNEIADVFKTRVRG